MRSQPAVLLYVEVATEALEAQRVVRDARRCPRAVASLCRARVPLEWDWMPHEQGRAQAPSGPAGWLLFVAVAADKAAWARIEVAAARLAQEVAPVALPCSDPSPQRVRGGPLAVGYGYPVLVSAEVRGVPGAKGDAWLERPLLPRPQPTRRPLSASDEQGRRWRRWLLQGGLQRGREADAQLLLS